MNNVGMPTGFVALASRKVILETKFEKLQGSDEIGGT